MFPASHPEIEIGLATRMRRAIIAISGTLRMCSLAFREPGISDVVVRVRAGTTSILHLVVRLIRSGYSGLSVWKNVVFMLLVSLVTAAAHLIQVALWAAAFLVIGLFPSFDDAFYYSAQSYTAVGYGDVAVSDQWRLLGPLESINGLLLFGLSTASMFAVMSRLIKNRLRLALGNLDESDLADQTRSGPYAY